MKLRPSLKTAKVQTFGNSMYPLLINQDVVHYKRISFSRIKVDDLIGFIKDRQIINHRVIYKNSQYVLTKGDHNRKPDSKVKAENIIGKIAYVKRHDKLINPENLYLLQSVNYFSEIIKVKKAFERGKINYVIIKGLPVHLHYTNSHPRRIYADCDILIDPLFYKNVDNILLSLGYKMQINSLNSLFGKILKRKTEVTYWKSIRNFIVSFDIHLEAVFLLVQTNNLSPLYPVSLVEKFSSYLLSRKKIISLSEYQIPMLTVENQIIYLALHLFHDNFKGYYKYFLFEQVINSSKFSEELIVKTIKEYRFENFLYPVFALLVRHYSPKLSKNFLKQIAPQEELKLMNQLINSVEIFQDDTRMMAGTKRFKNIYLLSPTNSLVKPLVFLKPAIFSLVIFVFINYLIRKAVKIYHS